MVEGDPELDIVAVLELVFEWLLEAVFDGVCVSDGVAESDVLAVFVRVGDCVWLAVGVCELLGAHESLLALRRIAPYGTPAVKDTPAFTEESDATAEPVPGAGTCTEVPSAGATHKTLADALNTRA